MPEQTVASAGSAEAGRRSGKTGPGLATREQLLRAAVDSIAELGCVASTTTVIAFRAGVSRGSLQHHFRTRDDLLLAVAAEVAIADAPTNADALAASSLEERTYHLYEYLEGICLSNRYAAAVRLVAALDADSVIGGEVRTLLEVASRRNQEIREHLFADIDLTADEWLSLARNMSAMIYGSAALLKSVNDRAIREQQIAMLLEYLRLRRRPRPCPDSAG